MKISILEMKSPFGKVPEERRDEGIFPSGKDMGALERGRPLAVKERSISSLRAWDSAVHRVNEIVYIANEEFGIPYFVRQSLPDFHFSFPFGRIRIDIRRTDQAQVETKDGWGLRKNRLTAE